MLNYATHLLLDAARMNGEIEVASQLNKAHDSLYRGGPEALYAGLGPYLFTYKDESTFSDWYLKKGWGNSWGVLFKTSVPLPELYLHFRNFIFAEMPDRTKVFFRFYDPRVLRKFLPTCSEQQLREFFGPINYFLVEDKDPAFVQRFWLENGVLKNQRRPLHEALKQALVVTTSEKHLQDQSGSFSAKPKPLNATTSSDKMQQDAPAEKPKSKWKTFE